MASAFWIMASPSVAPPAQRPATLQQVGSHFTPTNTHSYAAARRPCDPDTRNAPSARSAGRMAAHAPRCPPRRRCRQQLHRRDPRQHLRRVWAARRVGRASAARRFTPSAADGGAPLAAATHGAQTTVPCRGQWQSGDAGTHRHRRPRPDGAWQRGLPIAAAVGPASRPCRAWV